jgi:hypothetical protein
MFMVFNICHLYFSLVNFALKNCIVTLGKCVVMKISQKRGCGKDKM